MRSFRRPFDDVAALLSIVVLIAAAFADILFFHRALYIRDVARFFVPNFIVLRDLIQSGAFPFWNDRYNAGQPFAANPAYAALYPGHWIFTSLQLEVVAHYGFAAIGMYLFVRSLGLRIPASLFGAISFALGGMLLSLSNLTNVLLGMAWFPWLALAVRRRRFELAALVLGIILLIGDQATILQAGFLLIAYFARSREWKPLAVILACGFLVGSAQIVPALDHQIDSARATPLPYGLATEWKLPPARLLELALPSLFGSFSEWTYFWAGKRLYGIDGAVPWVFSFYNGLLVFTLALAGFIRRVRGWIFAASYIAFSFLIAATPLLYAMGLRSVRYPEKFFISGVFVLIVFASIACDQLPELRATAAVVAAIVAVLAALSLLLPFARLWQLSGYYGDLLQQAHNGAIVAITIAVVTAIVLAARRVPLALVAFVVAIDLGVRIPGLKPTIDASYYDPPPIARALRDARVYNDAEWQLAFTPTPHIPVEQRAWRLRNAMLPEAQAMWGVASVLESDITLTELRPSTEFRRAFLTARLQKKMDVAQRCLKAAGAAYVAEFRDPADATNPIRLVPLNHPSFYFERNGRVLRAVERPNAIDLDVDTTGATLFIAITRHKYWSGFVDGARTTLQPANIAFQSIAVPPGRHHVAMRYRNPLIVIFGVVSLAAVVALLAADFVAQHRRRRRDVERFDAA